MKIYILLARNSLYILTLTTDLISPITLCKAGGTVKDIAQIQIKSLNKLSHSIYFEGNDLMMSFNLNGIYLSFKTKIPIKRDQFKTT